MSRGSLIVFAGGVVAGAAIAFAVVPQIAIAQGSTGTAGLYQIQATTSLPQPGTSTIWRLNTATGALDFCTYNNVTVAGPNHVSCEGNTSPGQTHGG